MVNHGKSLDGIRAISMTWVILGHTYYYSLNESDNLTFILGTFTKPFYQNIGNALLSGMVKI